MGTKGRGGRGGRGSFVYSLTKVVGGEGGRGSRMTTQLGKDRCKTLQGLPLTMLILEGTIDSQLGKDLQPLCKDYL